MNIIRTEFLWPTFREKGRWWVRCWEFLESVSSILVGTERERDRESVHCRKGMRGGRRGILPTLSFFLSLPDLKPDPIHLFHHYGPLKPLTVRTNIIPVHIHTASLNLLSTFNQLSLSLFTLFHFTNYCISFKHTYIHTRSLILYKAHRSVHTT